MSRKEFVAFEFQKKQFKFPPVLNMRYIVGNQLEIGSFAVIFDCQDSCLFETNIVKVVSDVCTLKFRYRFLQKTNTMRLKYSIWFESNL